MSGQTPAWGTTVTRRSGPVPFLCYEPRRTQVAELLHDAARWGDREHLVQGRRRITFTGLFAAIDRVAARLREAGLRPGDRLLLLTPNSPEWVVTFWAGIKLGAIVALGNGWWSAGEIAHAVGVVEPRLVLADSKRAERLPDDSTSPAVLDVEVVRARVDDTAEQPGEVVPARVDEDEPAVIMFTAGTTGPPKAVVLAHRSVIANLHNLLVMSGRLPHQVDETKPPAVSLQSGPLFHIGGLQSLLLGLLGGNQLVFLEGRFDPGQVLDVIEREQVTWWGAIPTMASRVLEHPTLDQRDLRSVRSISMGGTAVQPALVDRLREAFPNAQRGMSTVYGMTETGGTLAAASGAMIADDPTTAGKPLPVVELRIDEPNDRGDGEIVVRTPGQMTGYWGGDSGETIDGQGWVHTGDLGHVTGGLLYVTGRIKDLIIRGGENIAPAHIESVLLRHPGVRNVAVIGVPDADLGERVAAVIHTAEHDAPAESELAGFAAAELAHFEVPSDWFLQREPLPMNESGKVDKVTLRQQWAAGAATGN